MSSGLSVRLGWVLFCVVPALTCGGGGGSSTTPTSPTTTTSSTTTSTTQTASTTFTTGVTGGETDLKVYSANSVIGPWANPKLVTISGVNALLAIDPQPILATDG